jgi:hypothetical protein
MPTVGTGLTVLQQNSSDDTLALVAFFAVGLYLTYNGFQKWQRKRLMQDTPTERVRSAAVVFVAATGGRVTIPTRTDHVKSALPILNEFGYDVRLETDESLPAVRT